MRGHMQRVARQSAQVALVVLVAVLCGGCLVGTTPPPGVGPGVEAVPAANTAAREILVIEQLHVLKKGEDVYYAENNRYATMAQLVQSGAMNVSPQGMGYSIDLTVTDTGYVVMAVPNEYGPNGKRSFYLDESGVVRGDDHMGGAPAKDDPVAN
ncbi:MAG TPA: type IV pilin protein [Blastocatellia bacterium]|nr:type IV pilin protein [Blastocatellia bacterium]